MPDREHLFNNLVRFQIELWNAVDARLRSETDLTLVHFESLRIVELTPDCRVNDVAEQLVISVGGASKVVDRLEAAGYCERRSNPGDRRSSILALTSAGEAALAAAKPVHVRVLEEHLPGDLDAFAATLEALRGAR